MVQLHTQFLHREHLCLVFEPLGVNLLQLLQQNQCTGLSCSLIRYFSKQLLQVLALLRDMAICHCDLKPENILLQNLHSPAIKLIDFGSACYASRPMHAYIQSRFYRSPEVLLGLRYSTQIDMWSMGTIVGELFLGLPLFPGETEYNQLHRIVKMCGVPPEVMLAASPVAATYFKRVPATAAAGEGAAAAGGKGAAAAGGEGAGGAPSPSASPDASGGPDGAGAGAGAGAGTGAAPAGGPPTPLRWVLKSEEQFCSEQGGTPCRNKQYFRYDKLSELITRHPPPKQAKQPSESELFADRQRRLAMLHFCEGLLQLDPARRWTPMQSLKHPFITGEPFSGSFRVPDREPSPLGSRHPMGGGAPRAHPRRPRAPSRSPPRPHRLRRRLAAPALVGPPSLPRRARPHAPWRPRPRLHQR